MRSDSDDGSLHEATVVADVDPSMRIFNEELFGPVAAIIPVKNEKAAITASVEPNLLRAVIVGELKEVLKEFGDVRRTQIIEDTGEILLADTVSYNQRSDTVTASGHVSLLHAARSQCDRLVLGLNSDASVRRLGKGGDRPTPQTPHRRRSAAA